MKRIFILVVALFLSMASGQANDGANLEIPQPQLRLLLPPAIYAVPGYEMNIYFDNIVLTENIKNYSFNVDCKYGRQDQDRWRFTPGNETVNFSLSIEVYDHFGKRVGKTSTSVYVSPLDAGKGRKISVLLVGDSLTAAGIYPKELYDLFKKPGNPDVKFIGSHSGEGKPEREGFPMIEGYGGWMWFFFYTKWFEGTPKNYAEVISPFLVIKDGKPILDFKSYCDKKNEEKAPDFITLFLGINNIKYADESNIESTVDAISKQADTLIAEFRKFGPDTKIAVVVIPPPAASQDAFGEMYRCGQSRFQYRRNQHRVAELTISKFGGREEENLFLIPVYVNLDCVNNYPQREEPISARNPKKIFRGNDGFHPAQEGYLQIADSFYAWFKYELTKTEEP